MLARAERLHRELFRPTGPSALPAWEPPVDVLETDHEVLVLVALPGVDPDRVEAAIDGHDLVEPASIRASCAPRSSIAWSFRKADSSAACASRAGATARSDVPQPTAAC